MKTLANCKPTEFLKQTNRIKKATEKWLTATDIMAIRRNMPELEVPDLDASVEEKARIMAENKQKRDAQVRANVSQILDNILDKHPDETLELLALVCFVEPKDVDDHTIDEYLTAITEMINNEAVLGFFTSLARWGVTNTSAV